ncbi:MAG TPA: hypothetical protein VGJ01_18450 [Pseudolabrys sp.]
MVTDIDFVAIAGDHEIVEGEIDRRHLHVGFVERIDADDAVLHRAHDLMVDQNSDAERARRRDGLRGLGARAVDRGAGKCGAQPVVGRVAGQPAELRRHGARDRLPAIDDIVDRLTRHAGGGADGNLVEAEPLDFRPEMVAWGQLTGIGRRIAPVIRGHGTCASVQHLLRLCGCV